MSGLRFVGGCGGGGVPTERYGAIRDWRDIHSLDHRTDTSGLHGTGDGSGKYPGNSWHITGTIGTPGLPLCPSESLDPPTSCWCAPAPMDGRVSFTPEQVTGSGGGPKTRVPIRHAVKPSFEDFAAGVFARQVSGPPPTLWAGVDTQLSLSLARAWCDTSKSVDHQESTEG